MNRRILLWKLLFAFFATCAVGTVAAWGILLTSFCSNPRTPMPETQHVIAYNCHGMTVFVTPFENVLHYLLIPLGGLFTLLSIFAGAMVVLTIANVRIDVQIHVEDTSNKGHDCD